MTGRILPVLALLCSWFAVAHAQDAAEFTARPESLSRVVAVVYSSDGSRLASAVQDGKVKLWDAASGRLLQTFAGEQINCIAFSPDGKMLAAGGSKQLIVWPTSQVRSWFDRAIQAVFGFFDYVSPSIPFARLDAPIRWVLGLIHYTPLPISLQIDLDPRADDYTSLAFSPDGRLLASYSSFENAPAFPVSIYPADSRVKVWKLETAWTTGPDSLVDAVGPIAFSPDGSLLATGGQLWDVKTWNAPRTVTGQGGATIAFSPDGKTLASPVGANINFADVASGKPLPGLSGPADLNYITVAFSRDSKKLAAQSVNGTVTIWDVTARTVLRSFSTGPVTSVSFSPDGNTIAAGGTDGAVHLWDATSGTELVALYGFTDGSYVDVTPQGYYDSSSAAAEQNLNVRVGDRVSAIATYRDGFYSPALVTGSLKGQPTSSLSDIRTETPAPVAEILDPPKTVESNVKLNVRVTDAGGGISEVDLYRTGADGGGSRVGSCNISAIPPAGTQSIACDPLQATSTQNASVQCATAQAAGTDRPAIACSFSVQLGKGKNILQAVALNANGHEGQPSTATIIATNESHARLHAVVIGIQDFQDSNNRNGLQKLNTPVADAQLIAQRLSDYSSSQPLFEAAPEINLLTSDASNADDKPTKENIVNALTKMQSSAVNADDVFVFYAASHGLFDGPANKQHYYLVASDYDSGKTDALKNGALSDDELKNLLGNIQAGKKLLVLDTCRAGAVDTDGSGPLRVGNDMKVTVLAATTSDQDAIDDYKGHGLFTYTLGEGLAGKGNALNSSIVTDFALANYVKQAVLEDADKKQNPHTNLDPNGIPFGVTEVSLLGRLKALLGL